MDAMQSVEAIEVDDLGRQESSALCELAASPDVPDSVLARLAGSPSEEVRRALAANAAAGPALLERLLEDPSEAVRWSAGETLFWMARAGLV